MRMVNALFFILLLAVAGDIQAEDALQKVCPDCNKKFGIQSKFCDNCGKPLIAAPTKAVDANDADPRLPVPAANDLKQAQLALRKTFDADYQDKTPLGRQALSLKLLKQADSTDIALTRYTALSEARDLAIQGVYVEAALKAVKRLSELFRVDGSAQYARVMGDLATKIRSPEEAKAFAVECWKVVQQMLSKDEYDSATKLVQGVQQTLKGSKGSLHAATLSALAEDLPAWSREFAKLDNAVADLKTNPNDDRANAVLGRFYCFVRGSWVKGLPMLVRSGDAALKSLADADLSRPGTPQDQFILGAKWQNYASKAQPHERAKLNERSALWLERSIVGLDGLSRHQAEQLIQQLRTVAAIEVDGKGLKVHEFADGKHIYSDFANILLKSLPSTMKRLEYSAPPIGGNCTIICRVAEQGALYLVAAVEKSQFDKVQMFDPGRWEYVCEISGAGCLFKTFAKKGELFAVPSTGQFGITTFFVAKTVKLNPELSKDYSDK